MLIDFGGVKEDVVTRKEFPIAKAKKVLKGETIAVIGYGVQGPAQALNMRDNGFNVIVGLRKGSKEAWARAKRDGWEKGVNLFTTEEALEKATVVEYLISDAAQKAYWPTLKKHLKPGMALYFSHGFSITYKHLTKVVPPDFVDVILVAPKGSGTSVRRNYLAGVGINASYAIAQDATGRATERCLALGIALGAGYLFPTTFEKEVYSDLTGERGVLMGALAGIMEAQYDVLRAGGHSPAEAFNETVEELTQSLIRLVDEQGMDWMYANCSATAQRGALDWKPKFKKATLPVFKELYKRVRSGDETKRVLKETGRADYKERLEKELAELRNSELWRAGAASRSLRPNVPEAQRVKSTKGTEGRGKN